MGAALSLMILSGIALFWPAREYLVTQSSFFLKMIFVGFLIINSFVIDTLMTTATHTPFRELSTAKKRFLLLSGGASFLCWVGAGITAFFLFP